MIKRAYMLRKLIHFISYLILQFICAQSVVATAYAHCFIYVGILLLLQSRTNLASQLLLAFGLGLMMDALYNTLGIHAFASVLVVYFKSYLGKLMLPISSSSDIKPSLHSIGFKSFSIFVLLLLFIHHTTVFFLEAGNQGLFLLLLKKALLSTLFSYLGICGMQAMAAVFTNNKL